MPYNDQYATGFNRRWKRYNECTYRFLDQLLSHVPVSPARVLDIGCGTGNVMKRLRQRFPSAVLHGADPSRAMLKYAEKNMQGETHFVQGAIEDVHETYDLITAASMLHYVEDAQVWMETARSLLRDGGHLIIIDWNGCAPLVALRKRWLTSYQHIAHIYTEEEIADTLQNFRIVARERRPCCGGWWAVQGWVLQR